MIVYLAGKVDDNGRMETRQVDGYQCFLPEFWKRAAREHDELGDSADVELIAAFGRSEELKAGEKLLKSKDLLMLMNSRYIYLPEVYRILYDGEAAGPGEKEKKSRSFSPETLGRYLDQAARGTSFEKGMRFEEAAAYFMEAAEGLRMRGNRTTILISKNGWTKDAEEEAKRQALQGIYILCITEEEMGEEPDAD